VLDGFQLLEPCNKKRGLIMRRKTVCSISITILESIKLLHHQRLARSPRESDLLGR